MGRLVDVLNTCNLDNPMQIMYMMYKVFSPVKEYIDSYNQSHPLKTEALQNCFNQIDRGDFQLARRFMYADFIGMDLLSIRDGDLTDSEQRFLDFMSYLISCNQKRMCKNPKWNLLSSLLLACLPQSSTNLVSNLDVKGATHLIVRLGSSGHHLWHLHSSLTP
jgi:hypothetical protein